MVTKITRSGNNDRGVESSLAWAIGRPPLLGDTILSYDFSCPIPASHFSGGAAIVETDYLSTPYALSLPASAYMSVTIGALPYKNFYIGAWVKAAAFGAGAAPLFSLIMSYRGPDDLDNPNTSTISSYTAALGIAGKVNNEVDVKLQYGSGPQWKTVYSGLSFEFNDQWVYMDLLWSITGYRRWRMGPFGAALAYNEVIPTQTATGLTRYSYLSGSLLSDAETWLVDRFVMGGL